MKTLDIDVRYYHQTPRAYITEADNKHRTLRWRLPVEGVALILVDVWSDHYVKSHLDRGRDITLTHIRPVLEAFRRIGALVVHAPSPDCARKYPAWLRYAGDDEVKGRSGGASDDWPPADFRRKTGDYAKWARPMEEKNKLFEDIIANRGIIPEVAPQGDDHVIVNGDQLHRVLRHRKALHLFYCGFAANMCVPFRDYGMRAMKARGYDIVLIRDCTSAIEVADTIDDLAISRVCVVDTELTVGYTVSSSDLVAACGKAASA